MTGGTLDGDGTHRVPVRPVYIGETPVYATGYDAERLTEVDRTLLTRGLAAGAERATNRQETAVRRVISVAGVCPPAFPA